MIAGVKGLLDGVTKWALQRESILTVALVGSQARGTASACSDVDLIILVREPASSHRSQSLGCAFRWKLLMHCFASR